jgi:hypothetical protein
VFKSKFGTDSDFHSKLYGWKSYEDENEGILDLVNLSFPIAERCSVTKLKQSKTVSVFTNMMDNLN